jgi:hypothetical protein
MNVTPPVSAVTTFTSYSANYSFPTIVSIRVGLRVVIPTSNSSRRRKPQTDQDRRLQVLASSCLHLGNVAPSNGAS